MTQHLAPRARYRSILRAGAAMSAVALLAGCGLVGIRTSDESGAPVGIAVAPTQGPEPEPTETGPQIPEGWTLEKLDLGGECGTRVDVALPPSAEMDTSAVVLSSIYINFEEPHEQMAMRVSCDPAFQPTAAESIAFHKEYEFSYGDATRIADRDIQVPGGSGWAYKAEAGPTEPMMIGLGSGSDKGSSYNVYAVRQADGQLEDVKVTVLAVQGSPEAEQAAQTINQHIFIDEVHLTVPNWQ